MPGGRRRSAHSGRSRPDRQQTERDRRRRQLGQNFLVDPAAVERLLGSAVVEPGDLVVEIGAGRGALTEKLAATGAEVWAVEPDRSWVVQAEDRVGRAGLGERVRLPRDPYRVVANLPFGSTTDVLAGLFDDPERGPWRADLLLQREVAEKHSATPPRALRTASWAPWWEFEPGPIIDRRSFRPVPAVDGRVLIARRRSRPVLPPALALGFREALRPAWTATYGGSS